MLLTFITFIFFFCQIKHFDGDYDVLQIPNFVPISLHESTTYKNKPQLLGIDRKYMCL